MADQSRTSRFRAQFVHALRAYQTKTSVTLVEHSLAIQLQSCYSIESVIRLLQNQAGVFSDLPGSDINMKSIESTVYVLSAISTTLSLDEAIDLPLSPAYAIYAGLAILLDAAKGVISSFNALVELLGSIGHLLKCLDIYTRVPPTPAMDEIVVKILVELLATLALATRELKQGRSIKFIKETFGEEDVETVLQRIDRLTQDEARITAAEVLNVIHGLVQGMRAVMEDGQASIGGVREDLNILHGMASDMNRSNRDRLLRDIQSWLLPPDPWRNHHMALKLLHRGTGAWFVDSDIFSEWKVSGQSSLLWIHGKPGSGKSVICSRIIEEIETMRKSGLASLAMFYHDSMENQKKDLRGLLSSVLVQLCHQSDSYCAILSKLFSGHGNGSQRPSDRALLCCFNDMVNLPGQAPIFLIVDALNECPNTYGLPSPREEVLRLIRDLVDSQLPNLHICVTSRPEVDIRQVLLPLTFRSISLHDEPGQMEDIENFIKSIINTDITMRRWRLDHKQTVIDVLTKRADGMFLWVYCQLECLRRCLPGRIMHTLDELPETLDDTYERILREINTSNWEFARRLLLCVSAAYHPFRVEELAEFLAFDFEASLIPKYREDWRPEDPARAVLSTCSTFLTVIDVNESPIIQFSHFSMRKFLMSSRLAEAHNIISRYQISMAPAHDLIAQACLGILLHLDENISRDSLEEFPLAGYAAKYWVEHARLSQNVEEGMKQLFDPRRPHLSIWVWIHEPNPHWRQFQRAKRPSRPRGTPLQYAALCGLHTVVKFLALEHSQDVSSRGVDDDSTPLYLAAQEGHVEVADVLLELGADLEAQDKNGHTALHQASGHGHFEFARLLIERRADLKIQDKNGRTPLHQVSGHGHVALARLLVEHGADPTAQDKNGRAPLHQASEHGHVDFARLLIEHGADPGVQEKNGQTPLHHASGQGHSDFARLLIEQGANPGVQDKNGQTPLHHASGHGHPDLVRLLIEHGADRDVQDKNGRTPLHQASEHDHSDSAQILVEHGADIKVKDKNGRTPLHQASERGHLDFARLLIEHGANPDVQEKNGRTPLHHASGHGRLDFARLLIKHGADINLQDKSGRTPLHHASGHSHFDVARLLIEHGADPNVQDKSGQTPLHHASAHGHFDFARLLMERGADLKIQDKSGRTPLHQASAHGHVTLARLLADHEADFTTQDRWSPQY